MARQQDIVPPRLRQSDANAGRRHKRRGVCSPIVSLVFFVCYAVISSSPHTVAFNANNLPYLTYSGGRRCGKRTCTHRREEISSLSRCKTGLMSRSYFSPRLLEPCSLFDNTSEPEGRKPTRRQSLMSRRPFGAFSRRRVRWLRRRISVVGFAIVTGWSSAARLSILPLQLQLQPKPAQATIMMQPGKELQKADNKRAGLARAKRQARERRIAEEKLATPKFKKECDEIMKSSGQEARDKYEQEWKEKRRLQREEKLAEKRGIVWDLLNQNIDPNGVFGQQILFEWEHGIDLSQIENTEQFQYERLRLMNPERYNEILEEEQEKTQRDVESLKEDNVDLVEYYMRLGTLIDGQIGQQALSAMATSADRDAFEKEKDKLKEEFREDGRKSPKRDYSTFDAGGKSSSKLAANGDPGMSRKAQKQAERERRKAIKTERKRDAERIRMEKKAEKDRLREQKKIDNEAAKVAEAAKAAAGAASMHESSLVSDEERGASTSDTDSELGAEALNGDVAAGVSNKDDGMNTQGTAVTSTGEDMITNGDSSSPAEDNAVGSQEKRSLPITNIGKKTAAAGAVAAVGGAGYYAFTVYKQKSADEEAERQRQFNLIMGLEETGEGGTDSPAIATTTTSDVAAKGNDSVDGDKEDDGALLAGKESAPNAAAPTSSQPPQKKKRGILGSVFKKQNTSGRETSLDNVLSQSMYPNTARYAQLLAKYLTVGAPGRFPRIEAMSLDDGSETTEQSQIKEVTENGEFRLDQAKENLINRKLEMKLSDEDAAETFANLVHVMIIELVDLASSATAIGADEKEKNKATIDAMNVVLDYMDHASSLFDAVAEDVTIKPVTYGGTLSKSKLEQMYSAYAGGAMATFDEKAQERMDTLQQVFDIRDKKAEGIMQKVMMKNLMSMMKEGEGGEGGMEGMADMMAAMGGGDGGGLEGMMPNMMGGSGDGEDISPEELKQSVEMMKELVESGSVSKEELDLVRKQFKDSYGADISELISAADNEDVGKELGEDGKELLDLFKNVLGDDK